VNRAFVSASVLLAALCLAAPVRADGDVMDVVLVDGTRVRGRVEELVPGEGCTVRLKSGARRILVWDDIKRIVPPGTPDLEASPPPPLPAPKPPPPPARKVRVEVKASRPVRIEMSVDGGRWELACSSPCGVELPVDAAYRIVENGDAVKGFRLEADGRDNVTVDVSLASGLARGLGIAGLVIGSIVAYGAYAALASQSSSYESTSGNEGVLALVMLGGAALAVGSGIAVATSGAGISQSGPTRDTPASGARVQPLPRSGISGTVLTLRF
jgi:hypothetical protein